MNPNTADVHSRWVQALKTQRPDDPSHSVLGCPYGHSGRIFQNLDQLYDHTRTEHAKEIEGLRPSQARDQIRELVKQRKAHTSDATVGGGSTEPDIKSLTLEPEEKERQPSPVSKKRPAEETQYGRRKGPAPLEIVDQESHGIITPTAIPERTRQSNKGRLYDPKSPETNTASPHVKPQSPARQTSHQPSSKTQRPGLIELQRYDSRYPGLLLQPDSRPISQEQLASEVKSIYAGLTMVETKCIHVDRAQAAVAQENKDPNNKLASDHWQALIALHRTLLHEHHDFFLASQHPSASPALRRLAAKYSMPARMWKHGIHSFLELLRRRLPDSIDYMLAFIYLAYQMMALLYETVPAFEDTWIECLGDLGRYRMAIEDEDIRDRETWAGVARSWYTKAADKNPTVGRLYHHLAILARPNALQQLYYYSRSLTCIKPFPSARESILTLLDPILGRAQATYSHALPIDTNYIKAHALLFEKLSLDGFQQSMTEFTNNLDNHIGRVTAKWKEQGVYIAVTNISGLFEYGIDDNALRQVFLTQLEKVKNENRQPDEQLRTASPADQQDPASPIIPAHQLPAAVSTLSSQPHYASATSLLNDTFSLVLRRIGDKNVLPHVHIMLSFLTTFAADEYVCNLIEDTPWVELVAFLNTLVKTENHLYANNPTSNISPPHNIDTLFSSPIFPSDGERTDELPLPEDYLVRGLIWAHDYFPKKWFEREHDEEERYLELASTVKSRMERVLRLGHKLSKHKRWITYDNESHMFSVTGNTSGA